MPEQRSQARYWDRVAAEKTFHHPLNLNWLAHHAKPESSILDVGCGYGRTLEELRQAGYPNTMGVDFAAGMLARYRSLGADPKLVQASACALPFAARSFDAVLLFTTLTCISTDDDQHATIGEITRLLRPGGLVYISDLLLNSDDRNRDRYEHGEKQFGFHGVFELPEGAVMRHHSEQWIVTLTAAFSKIEYRLFDVVTMNGNPSRAFQYLGRLP